MGVAARYRALQEEIAELARVAGRSPSEITLVAVSKTYPLDHVLPAYETGCRDFGENRVQEALQKMEDGPPDLRWHLIGTLQENKVRKVIGRFALIHSVDSIKLAKRLAEVSSELGVETRVLLQVNSSGESTKHGWTEKALKNDFERVAGLAGLRVEGLMTMAPFTDDKERIRSCFRGLRRLRDTLDPSLPHLSMGMTQDYPIAIEEGATILRIGSKLFGAR